MLGAHSSLFDKFKAGKIDILRNPTADDIAKLPGQRMQVSPYWSTRLLLPNLASPKLKELALRKAILQGIKRDQLPAALKNGERRVTGLIPPGLLGYRELPLVTSDAAQARLQRAQVKPADQPIELKLLAKNLDSDRATAQWIAGELLPLQIRLKPIFEVGAGFLRELEAGHFDLALMNWDFEMATPLQLLRSFHTGAAGNWGKWTHVPYDSVLDQVVKQHKPEETGPAVDQLTQMLEAQEVGAIPLGYPTQPFLLGSRVISFAVTAFGDPDLVKIQLKQ
jgi:ABC-type oligopeptide transport system substrate-binding subunit